MTKNLLDNYSEINELDMSRAVDELLYGRLKYLEEAEIKAKEKINKQYTPEQYKLIKDFKLEEEDIEPFLKWYKKVPYYTRTYSNWIWSEYMIKKWEKEK